MTITMTLPKDAEVKLEELRAALTAKYGVPVNIRVQRGADGK